jgi:hypothetical protein
MIIQLWHSRDTDFQKELYTPIQKSDFFGEHKWIFPHDTVEVNSRETLKEIDLFIAEVSQPATGLGIELGFASSYGKQIHCISKKWSKISSSLKYIAKDFIEYDNDEDMIRKLWEFLKNS